ncbi:phage virion morphogenesis protein [Aeromonas hydrophila]|uniref:phage virion morphogenesis protein n=1 Tax=Aeromonas hydrophila TaxID=644 RepID=UPI00068A76BE|nr:phage virion morphogenesis protein [Aeromonas hydrophila]
MSGTSLNLTVKGDLQVLLKPLKQLQKAGGHPAPLLKQIAALGENTTRARFADEEGPDGEKWVESLRKQLQGGKTLTRDGHLSGSITGDSSDTEARWGSNRIYAAIHQFGGVIKAKTSKGLAFTLASGDHVVTQSVTMPARPFLGLNQDDEDDIVYLVRDYVNKAMGVA